jgi:biotin carboxylase
MFEFEIEKDIIEVKERNICSSRDVPSVPNLQSVLKHYAEKLYPQFEEILGPDYIYGDKEIINCVKKIATIRLEIVIKRCSSSSGDGCGGIDSTHYWESYALSPRNEAHLILKAAYYIAANIRKGTRKDAYADQYYLDSRSYLNLVEKQQMEIVVRNLATYLYFEKNKLCKKIMNEITEEY